jgi:DNA-binding MarR family transcriptional regulator
MTERFDIDRFLPYRMTRIAEEVSRRFARAYKDRYGMTRPEWRAIAIIGARGEVTAAQIRDDSTMHKTMVSRAVAGLEKRRWVERSPLAHDGRSEMLRLTRLGRGAHDDLMAMARDWQARLMADLGPGAAALPDALTAIEERLSIEGPMRATGGE